MAFYRVEKRIRADGSPRYRCAVRVKNKGKIVFNESRTFIKKAAAEAWGKKRSQELTQHGVKAVCSQISLSELLDKYLNDNQIHLGDTKRYVLTKLKESELATLSITDIKAHHVVTYAKNRCATGVKGSTVMQQLSYLKWCMRLAKPNFGYEVSDECVNEAKIALYDQRVIFKAEKRSRRPTDNELEKIKARLVERQSYKCGKIPFIDILDFSILSCMRIGEVCSIRWEDVDKKQKAVMVRDRKDPRKKIGNHMMVPLIGGAWEIIQKQPKTDERIFPFNKRSVSKGFQDARTELGIKDLRYHDLRREGASRLLEKGYAIDEVAQVTGHKNINTLWQIYTDLFPNRLQDKENQTAS
ncbi:site-specific integrase [Parashewanella curva]|uniref:Site-specific integrase n=1 Tax=Parashewanella curva TaxID=2338552 RepID=A0A3L8Q0C4_9GAMM|nr:site-specific integrase [Parashewanella curva]RLV61015.1 site-specific integrase [Parashewanella curva]